MLRLPLTKIYRAFPELDPFSNEQCERYVALAIGKMGCVFYLVPPLAVIALFVVCVFCLVSAGKQIDAGFQAPSSDWQVLAFLAGGLSLLFGVPLVGGFLARDILLHRLLRRHVRNKIERSRCPVCRYSLLGQRIIEGLIRCPECGNATTLATLGLKSEADLIPPAITHSLETPAAGSPETPPAP